MLKNYSIAKLVTNELLDKENPNYEIYLLAIYGLLSKYPKYKDLVIKVFTETHIMIGNESIYKIMEHKGLNPNECIGANTNETNSNLTLGVSSLGVDYYFNNNKFINKNTNPYIICTTKYCDKEHLLLTLCHEANHLMKGKINNTYTTKEEDYFGYVIRCGFSIYEYRYYPADSTYSESLDYDTIDEAINCLQTTEIMQEILALDGIIRDKKIQDFFNALNKEELKEDDGYEEITHTLTPLWQNKTFKNLIEDNTIEGNINKIINKFNKKVGTDAFENLNELLLEIEELDINNKENTKEMLDLKNKVQEIITLYNKNTKNIVKQKNPFSK